ncbi:M48 family metalloprotease [Chitinophagales bacterium]|nr:M48 family metalloprotease [Chitinophagales bacterium]
MHRWTRHAMSLQVRTQIMVYAEIQTWYFWIIRRRKNKIFEFKLLIYRDRSSSFFHLKCFYYLTNSNMQALPYHKQVRDYLKKQKRSWEWFAKAEIKQQQVQEFRAHLLRNSYRIDATANSRVHELLEQAKQALSLECSVALYQAAGFDQMNAGISFLNEEAHLVFSGNLLSILDDQELLALLAHELSHILLFSIEAGEYELSDRMIAALADNQETASQYAETARLFSLSTELYCDRAALKATEAIEPIISLLLKMQTGLSKVSVESFLKQADELLQSEEGSKGVSHPENFIRAKSLQLYFDAGEIAEDKIHQLLVGKPSFYNLDVFLRGKLKKYTKTVLQQLLSPEWMRTDENTNLASQYFKNFDANKQAKVLSPLHSLLTVSESSSNYFSYLLYDFVSCDPELKNFTLAWCWQIAQQLDITNSFKKTVRKEQELSARRFQFLLDQSTQDLNTLQKDKEGNVD